MKENLFAYLKKQPYVRLIDIQPRTLTEALYCYGENDYSFYVIRRGLTVTDSLERGMKFTIEAYFGLESAVTFSKFFNVDLFDFRMAVKINDFVFNMLIGSNA